MGIISARPALADVPDRHPILSAVVHASTTALMLTQHAMFIAIDDWAYHAMAYAVPAGYVLYYAWFLWSRRCLMRECAERLLRDAIRRSQTPAKYR